MEGKSTHPGCASKEDCVGASSDRLVEHTGPDLGPGTVGDIYCETCWGHFLDQTPELESEWAEQPGAKATPTSIAAAKKRKQGDPTAAKKPNLKQPEPTPASGSKEDGGKEDGGKEKRPAPSDLATAGQGLTAKTRKAQRSFFRMSQAPGERAGYLGPSSSAPPPFVCNRVALCEWKSGGSGCQCEKWPQWLSENKDTGRVQNVAKFNGNTAIDPEANDIEAEPGACSTL